MYLKGIGVFGENQMVMCDMLSKTFTLAWDKASRLEEKANNAAREASRKNEENQVRNVAPFTPL